MSHGPNGSCQYQALKSAAPTGSSEKMSAARTAVVWRCAQFMTKKAAAVMRTPVNATTPAKRSGEAGASRGASRSMERSAPARVKPTCAVTKGASGWRGDHSAVNTTWSANAIAQPSVSRSPSRVAGVIASPKGRVSTRRPTTARATPAQLATRTRRPSRNRAMNGTRRTDRPVMKPERAGVV